MIDLNVIAGIAGLGGAGLLVGSCLCAARDMTLRPPVTKDPEEQIQDLDGGRTRWWERLIAIGVCVALLVGDWMTSVFRRVHRRFTELCPRCGQMGTRGLTGRMNCLRCKTTWRVVNL